MSFRNSLKELKVGIGDVILSAVSKNSALQLGAEENYKPFISYGKPNIVLGIHCGENNPCKLHKKVFDLGGSWRLYRHNGNFIFRFCATPRNLLPYHTAEINPDFTQGDVYIQKQPKSCRGLPVTLKPIQYPLDEFLVINILSRSKGLIVHACGIKENKKGLLFIGNSGRGKSTMANLWKLKRTSVILSDDRVIIRRKKNRFWIYGTPWHGEAGFCSPEGTPLDKIFFIEHSEKNKLKKISPTEKMVSLISYSFPSFWDKTGMELTLKFCAELAQEIPCYILGFAPDERVLSFVKRHI